MDDEPVLISSLAHYAYCPRRCGLIHIEMVWEENVFTLRGRDSHERTDAPTTRTEKGRIIERGLPIWSNRLGLVGQADTVEFMADDQPYPIEYKSGSRNNRDFAQVQLCAQALCLEEMFDCRIPEGAIYWIASCKREIVPIDTNLREATMTALEDIRAMLLSGKLPGAVNDNRCPKCSLVDACVPGVVWNAARINQNSLYIPQAETELP
ncbi:CRISPR-associated protein Cas4 [Kamptonema cortianum]|nr:CRISPR-associated protein Cas4 [Kamptonema cortianum]